MELNVGQSIIRFVKGDITTVAADAIVNAANPSLMGGGGVDGAIHRAGGTTILDECRRIISEIGRCRPGQAVMTTGGKLPARYVIHTVGPVWHGGSSQESELLSSAYRESLSLAGKHGLRSVAFPSISTGVYGYPIGPAAAIAVKTVAASLSDNPSIREVIFVLFDGNTYEAYESAASELQNVLIEQGGDHD